MVTEEEEDYGDYPSDADFIQAARNIWTSDDLEIDPDPVVSAGDEGAFVAAWVWVSNSEAGMEEED